MIIRLPSGELRDEIPYSFSFRGREQAGLSPVMDPEYFVLEPTRACVKDKHCVRIESVQILCDHPTLVSLMLSRGNLAPVEIANWTAVAHFFWATGETNRNVIDLEMNQCFSIRAMPITEKFGEVIVVFNGRLRRPVNNHR